MDIYVSDPQTRKRKIECKPELVISSLQKFYANHPEIDKVLQYLNGDAPLSLRIIDWFVTKYSRKNFIRYMLNGHEFLVYLSYKGQLKAYSKQYFDPNCRRERIMFKIPNYDQFMTTIGKLNFFRWALESKILDYIELHEDDIRKGYNLYLKEITQTQKQNKNLKDIDDVTDITDVTNAAIMNNINDITNVTTDVTDVTDITNVTDTSVISAASVVDPTKTIMSSKTKSMIRTTRRRTKQSPSSLTKLQVYTTPIELDFH